MSDPSDPKRDIVTAAERALLAALLDELLPASGELPAASELGLVDAVGASERDARGFAAELRTILDAAAAQLRARGAAGLADLSPAERFALVQTLEASAPAAFIALTRRAHLEYYTHARIPPLVGMPDRPPQPLGHKQPENDDLETLLAPVRARGKHYRDA